MHPHRHRQALRVHHGRLLHAPFVAGALADDLAIKFNGISLPDYGQTFTISDKTTAEPGGHLTAPNSTLQLNGLTIFSGNIDWSLPDGGPGDRKEARSFSVANGAKVAGFRAGGMVKLELGQHADNSFYSVFGLNLELPVQFKAGPDPAFGSVSAGRSVLSTTRRSTSTA